MSREKLKPERTTPLYREHRALSLDEIREQYRDKSGTGISVGASKSNIGVIFETDDRVKNWMRWKTGEAIVRRVTEQMDKAGKRHSRGTTIPLDDLATLLALATVGEQPR